ncbi:MAG TPA: hypothetical protein H9722_04570 [Candidatus Mediterraneibacter pullistercoris]|nr:hypothetical protein [Candidatus Mediterraneibacter pullistercoris]
MRKYKLTTNLGLKITAFIFSVFLWLIVVNVDNPIGSSTFTDVPVTIVNEDIITSAGDVYQVIGEETVSVVVYANREVRQDLSAEDIIATADISEMDTSTGLVPVTVTIPEYSGDYESAEAVPRNLRIQREKSGRKVLALTVETDGVQRDGYILGEMTVHPENVTITGAESLLEQIDRAAAKVDIDGISRNKELQAALVLYDANGNELSQNQLKNNLGEDGLTVSIEVLQQKSVPIVADVSGTPAEGYQYTGCVIEPESAQICGSDENLSKVDEIRIPAEAIDISNAEASVEQTVDITPYLPEGVELAETNSGTVKVTAQIEEEGTRTINLLVSSIRMDNLSDLLQVSFEPDAEISLQFRGDQEALDMLDISNAVSVDLRRYTRAGTYEIPVEVNIPDGITLISEETVTLTLEKKVQEQPEQEHGTQEESGTQNETSDEGREEEPAEG